MQLQRANLSGRAARLNAWSVGRHDPQMIEAIPAIGGNLT
jgi:hypothetical protein